MKQKTLLCLFIISLYIFTAKAQSDSVIIEGNIRYPTPPEKAQILKVTLHELAFDEEVNYITSIGADGTFKISIPLDRPSEVILETGELAWIFCTPGTKMFLTWTEPDIDGTMDFQGENADLNRMIKKFNKELEQVRRQSGSYAERYEPVKNFPDQYKAFEFDNLKRDLNFYENFIRQNQVSDLFQKLKKYDMEYNCAWNLMRYRWTKPKDVTVPDNYFDFFDRFPLENPDALISSYYSDWYLHEYYMYLSDSIRKTLPARKPGIPAAAGAILERLPDISTEDRPELERIAGSASVSSEDSTSFQKIALVYLPLIKDIPEKIPMIEHLLKQPSGLLNDLLFSWQLYLFIEANILPPAGQYIDTYIQKVKNEQLTNKVLNAYNEKKLKLTSYTLPANANLNAPLNGTGSSFFQKLTEKYKDRVIYIDFWATWCSPCRAEMPYSQKLKEELGGKPVIFVYLGVQSDEKTWKAVIADLKIEGEHYLLDDSEYKLLSNRFQINGIPHYVLIDKAGNIVHPKAPRPGDPALKNEIITLIAR